MVNEVENKKPATTRSIYIPDEDKGLDKEINKIAKDDEQIDENLKRKRGSLTSYATIRLWKLYKRLHEEKRMSLFEIEDQLEDKE